MELNKVTIIGGGVLGTQIGLMCAYVGKDVTFWLRSEGSVERTKPKLKQYSELMLRDLLAAKALIASSPILAALSATGIPSTPMRLTRWRLAPKRTFPSVSALSWIWQARLRTPTLLLKLWPKTPRLRLPFTRI